MYFEPIVWTGSFLSVPFLLLIRKQRVMCRFDVPDLLSILKYNTELLFVLVHE